MNFRKTLYTSEIFIGAVLMYTITLCTVTFYLSDALHFYILLWTQQYKLYKVFMKFAEFEWCLATGIVLDVKNFI